MKRNNGITLIALVVTIVVLIILAGITITSLTGEKSIIKEARTSKELTEKAALEEQIELAIIKAEQKHKNPTIDDVIEEIKNNKIISDSNQVNKETGDISSDLGYLITGKLDDYIGKVSTGDDEGEDKNEAPIPEGFYHAGGTVEEGFVISDVKGDDLNNTKHGNQFVWVPVPNIEDFHQIPHYFCGAIGDEFSLTRYSEPYENGYEGEIAEYNNMFSRVKENHGFYIGRYEAGKGTDGEVVVKKNVLAYDNIGWNSSWKLNDEKGGALEKAKNFTSNKSYKNNVTSTLIYDVQWDAIMQFMDNNYIKSESDENSYVRNSQGKGWYGDNYQLGNPDHKTGIDVDEAKSNCVKNIYDMAGNLFEWTMAVDINVRTIRGGSYSSLGNELSASVRTNSDRNTGASVKDFGFRIALYL